MCRGLPLLVIILLTGCESMPRGEMYYQTLHAVDTLQTINGPANDPCYSESGAIPKLLMGENPTKGQALAWGVGWGAFHYGVSRELDRNAPDWVLGTWQLLTTGEVALTIHRNHSIGIRPWGENDHSRLRNPEGC